MDKYEITIRYINGGYAEFTTNEESKINFLNKLNDDNVNVIEITRNKKNMDVYIFKNNICCVEVIDNENNMYK
ncbi:TPA: hypothetical protein ACXDAB_003475 [Clostridium botulinum]|uniref:hypothetical protein n=1 Tax=Clostridium botulinum TaxID=1491 RepID=UPI000774B6FC|nr:hypothetical protein [Clostridium botulinum]